MTIAKVMYHIIQTEPKTQFVIPSLNVIDQFDLLYFVAISFPAVLGMLANQCCSIIFTKQTA